MSAPTRVRSLSCRVAATQRHHGADAPETHEARRDLAAARLEQFIKRTVDAAPPLTLAQRDRLALLLRNAPAAAPRPTTRPAA